MKVLLVDDNAASRQKICELLIERAITALHPVENLEEGIEVLKYQAEDISLAICNYRGHAQAPLENFLKLSEVIPRILILDKKSLAVTPAFVPVERGNWEGLTVLLNQFRRKEKLDCRHVPDTDLVKVATDSLTTKLTKKLFARLAPGYYSRINPDQDRSMVTHFFLEKSDFEKQLSEQNSEPDPLLANPQATRESLLTAASDKLDLVHDVVGQLGFTPQVQELAKRAVELVLRAVGSNPKLARILDQLQLQQGRYIASHSLMLAEVSCALAYRVGMGSAPTFLKLALASFIHDLSLEDGRLARVGSLEEVSAENGFSAEDARVFKMHPLKAAEFSHQLEEMPPDLDMILIQHHERPAGNGFPRGLYHHQIGPLSCLFIMAHDLLGFFLENEPANPSTNRLEAFLFRMDAEYREGTFRRLAHSLETGEPFQS